MNRQLSEIHTVKTKKPSCRWQTRATRKHAQNCSNSTCLQRWRWQYWLIFIRLAVAASEICEIPRNSLKIQTYRVQGHPRSSILVSMERPCDFILVIFHPPLPCFTSPSGGTPWDIDRRNLYTAEKCIINGLQFRRWHYRSIVIRLAVVASQSREITRNSDNIWPYSSSRSSKVIDLGVNRKPMYDFLLVINSNFGRICYRFRDIDA